MSLAAGARENLERRNMKRRKNNWPLRRLIIRAERNRIMKVVVGGVDLAKISDKAVLVMEPDAFPVLWLRLPITDGADVDLKGIFRMMEESNEET